MSSGETRKGRLRRDEIVLHAARLFAERGYEGTSMSDVAERVGLRKASLFHHFASKDELYEAALGTLVGTLSGAVIAAAAAEGSFADRLDSLIDAMVETLSGDPDVAKLVLREALNYGPVMRGALGQSVVGATSTAVAFAQAGVEAGELKLTMPAQELAISLVSALLLPFAASEFAQLVTGVSPTDPAFAKARADSVKRMARLVVGLPPSKDGAAG